MLFPINEPSLEYYFFESFTYFDLKTARADKHDLFYESRKLWAARIGFCY
jgi:hypothetical protein